MIIGAAVALVVVVALAIIILGSKDEEPTGTQDTVDTFLCQVSRPGRILAGDIESPARYAELKQDS